MELLGLIIFRSTRSIRAWRNIPCFEARKFRRVNRKSIKLSVLRRVEVIVVRSKQQMAAVRQSRTKRQAFDLLREIRTT